jgi:pyridoxal phosphate enzyme (YggS family)
MGHIQNFMVDPGLIRKRLDNVRQQIEIAARRCDRDPREISLIAISKTHPPEVLRLAIRAGVSDLGENRVQEAEAKITVLGRHAVRWHLVGHLQANKARRAVRLFDLLHSLDSVSLALRLNQLCVEEKRAELPVLVQVDLENEKTKSGVKEEDLKKLVDAVSGCQRLRLAGLMALPPFFENPEHVRPFFRRLRQLRDELTRNRVFRDGQGELSMGMSHDFTIAIEEGATMVRVGTAIFGEREQ